MIVADFGHSTPLFERALAASPAASLTFDRMYATREPDGDGEVRVRIRVVAESAAALGRLDRELDADPTVAGTLTLSDGDDGSGAERRYRVSLTDAGEAASAYSALAAADAALVTGAATAAGWTVRLRVPDREALGRYRKGCADRGVSPELRRLRSDENGAVAGTGSVLTEPQAAILRRAVELGYFEIPRSVSLAEVGESLDITGQAASERLRRALSSHLGASLRADGRLVASEAGPPLGGESAGDDARPESLVDLAD